MDYSMDYQKKIVLNTYECNSEDKMKLSYMLRHMQEAAGLQLRELGLPYEKLYNEGMVFLLSKVMLSICKVPKAFDELIVSTCPQGVKGAQFLRRSHIADKNGNVMIYAQSAWMLVSPKEKKVLRPSMFTYKIPSDPNEYDAKITGNKLRPTEFSPEIFSEREIKYTDIDCNGHVNNAVYADIIEDALPTEAVKSGARKFVINYQTEVKLGEILKISIARQGDEFLIYGYGGNQSEYFWASYDTK